MSEVDKDTVRIFGDHCDWAHQCWLMRKHLYDENPEQQLLKLPQHAHFFVLLGKILQEYWILEVAKLHDKAIQSGSINLSVEHICTHGNWDSDVQIKLDSLKNEMACFVSKIKPARNKLLSHKDKDTIMSSVSLGEFQKDDDVKYFQSLHEFANEVHIVKLGTPFLFDDLTQNDVEVFMSAFSQGVSYIKRQST